MVIYRMQTYEAVPAKLEAFNLHFRDRLLPIQLRHGARLVGRWQTDNDQVIAIWEYDSKEDYNRIEAAVRADPDSASARAERRALGVLFTRRDEVFMGSSLG